MPPRWILAEHAIARGAFALRCSRDKAEDRLYELMVRASYRETDRAQRELYRSPARDGAMRWVIDAHATPPKVIWVGQGKPPAEHWDPAPDGGGARGDVRLEIVMDAGAHRMLSELREAERRRSGNSSPPAEGDVIGQAIRMLYDRERGRL